MKNFFKKVPWAGLLLLATLWIGVLMEDASGWVLYYFGLLSFYSLTSDIFLASYKRLIREVLDALDDGASWA